MMGVNVKEMFNCTYENLYPLKKMWCKMNNIQTISEFGTTCHSKLLQKVILNLALPLENIFLNV
jgi:hypothetical protein